jgi:hypothetical protein
MSGPESYVGSLEDRMERDRERVARVAEASGNQEPPDHETPPRVFTTVNLGDLATAELTPPRFVVEPLIPRGVTTLLGGHGGAGKSNLALILAAHVAVGQAMGPYACERGRVLFASLEDGPELIRFRLRRIAAHYGLDADVVADRLSVIDATSTDGALAVEVQGIGTRQLVPTNAYHELRELASGFDLVVVDNASDAYEGPENERRHVRRFMRQMLGAIAKENDAGLLLLVHIDKAAARAGSNGNTYSGSTAWHNSARSRLALVESDGRIELHHEKLNVGKKADSLRLQWSTEGVLEPVVDADAGLMTGTDADIVMHSIKTAADAGVTVGTARTGSPNTLSTLSTFGLPEYLKANRAKRFWEALNILQRSARIRSEEYTDNYRKRKFRWVIT